MELRNSFHQARLYPVVPRTSSGNSLIKPSNFNSFTSIYNLVRGCPGQSPGWRWKFQAPWGRRRYGCFSMLPRSNNQVSLNQLKGKWGLTAHTKLQSPGVWSGPQLWLPVVLETAFLWLWFQPQGGFLSLKWLSPPLGSACFLFQLKGPSERPKLCTDWITSELLSGEIHVLIGLDLLLNQSQGKNTLVSLDQSAPTKQEGQGPAHPSPGLNYGRVRGWSQLDKQNGPCRSFEGFQRKAKPSLP